MLYLVPFIGKTNFSFRRGLGAKGCVYTGVCVCLGSGVGVETSSVF